MKKGLMFLIAMCICGMAYAAVRVAVANPSGDGQVTSSNTILVDANIYFKGVTVGDKVELRKGSSTGSIFFTAVAATANGNVVLAPAEPIMIDGGIYMDETKSGGITGMNLIYQ
jgi:hypothetical protein